MTIRLAKPSESKRLTEIGIQSKSIWNYSEEAMAVFRDELLVCEEFIESGLVYVFEESTKVIGYYLLKPLGRTTVELEHLFISPGHIHNGIGSALFQHAIDESKRRNFSRMQIQSDPNAAGFYERLGLAKVADIPSSIPGRSIPQYEVQLDAND